jgi:hypothetical protein
MSKFKNRQQFEEWAFDQFKRYGIRQPDTYSEQELIDLNPTVPADFITQHTKARDAATMD